MRTYLPVFGVRVEEDPVCCVAEISEGNVYAHQCSRKRGHGPDGLYCKQHAKMEEEVKGEDTQTAGWIDVIRKM
ncbi:hypothetical protein LCGC14_1091970 [marine sediment metagenome]|uniref:Uncharacterized protein n=1 Tax=marine sediment metagenome TaxID=412755 RepID=A0A0F9QI40_9ZZZZ